MFRRLIKDNKLARAVFALTAVFLVFGVWLYFHSKITSVSQEPILNSYYNQDYKYSLAIPSSWMGQYVVNEIKEGDTAFVYLGDGKTTFPIFILSAIPDSQWLGQKNSSDAPEYITESSGYTYAYRLITNNSFDNVDKRYAEEFSNMAGKVKGIVKTIKFNQ
jgi:hypothetical protein